MSLKIDLHRYKVHFYDCVGKAEISVDLKKFDYPLVYAFLLPEDFMIEYPGGFSRTIYIGRSHRQKGRSRLSAHLKWAAKLFLLNPRITHFSYYVSKRDCLSENNFKNAEADFLSAFADQFGDIPIFNFKQEGKNSSGTKIALSPYKAPLRKFGEIAVRKIAKENLITCKRGFLV